MNTVGRRSHDLSDPQVQMLLMVKAVVVLFLIPRVMSPLTAKTVGLT